MREFNVNEAAITRALKGTRHSGIIHSNFAATLDSPSGGEH